VRVLRGGESLSFGDGGLFEVAYTPGHASHPVSFLHDSGTAFVGDVGGVRIAPDQPTIPPSPPPDIDLEAWHGSIELVRAWRPGRLAMTHFGSSDDVDAQLDELGERLDRLAEVARGGSEEQFIATLRAEIAAPTPELANAYEEAAPPWQLYMGLERYWRKRAERLS
jgi:glyoxylase-like metal-dependent hydrolase (beta-lactamase superfamily II)